MSAVRHPIAWLKAHPVTADVLLAVAVTVAAIPGQWTTPPDSEGMVFHRPDMGGVVLALLASAPLLWRRARPLTVLLVIALASSAYEILGYASVLPPMGVLVGLYTVAAHCDRSRSRLGLAFVSVGLAVVLVSTDWEVTVGTVAGNVIIFVTVWLVGDNLQARRATVEALEERAERAEQTRAAEAERAVAEERTRIARDLHDVVAHSMSVMVVQATAARRVLDREPGQAAAALDAIESTGREAMTEMRRLLGVLRDDRGEPAALAPQPSIDGLSGLVGQFVEAGLPATLELAGPVQELPAGVALSAYRIVQEALTNALKHAGPATKVEVTVRYRDDDVEVEVLDDGRGVAPAGADRGHGLLGMRERVDVCGGELRTGPRAGGGFAVRARLPLVTQAG
jgi:signal transduction histidine kinase